jgi:hypothetical protein
MFFPQKPCVQFAKSGLVVIHSLFGASPDDNVVLWRSKRNGLFFLAGAQTF